MFVTSCDCSLYTGAIFGAPLPLAALSPAAWQLVLAALALALHTFLCKLISSLTTSVRGLKRTCCLCINLAHSFKVVKTSPINCYNVMLLALSLARSVRVCSLLIAVRRQREQQMCLCLFLPGLLL